MRCPTCVGKLSPIRAGSVHAHACETGCGGVWLDGQDIERVERSGGMFGAPLLDAGAVTRVPAYRSDKRLCPRCPSTLMQRHFHDARRPGEVDECPACRGIWLDLGDLGHRRARFECERSREDATRRHLSERFTEPLLAMLSDAAHAQSARGIAASLRFVCPTYSVALQRSAAS